jgi:hypothetical protein|tara:strand:- start:19 stop:192 length:174 start_codon:yes stop_codon:yes gene_type:complete
MLITRIVQLVLFLGLGSMTFLAIRVLRQDIRDHREMKGLEGIPIDYNGDIRREVEKR